MEWRVVDGLICSEAIEPDSFHEALLHGGAYIIAEMRLCIVAGRKA